MAIIGLLTYPDFEMEVEDQFRPIRVQAYSKATQGQHMPIENITYYVELGYHTEEDDTLICRWRIGHIQAVLTRNNSGALKYQAQDQVKHERLMDRAERAADLLRGHLVAQDFYVMPGLIQLSEPVKIETEWPDFWLGGALDAQEGAPDAD